MRKKFCYLTIVAIALLLPLANDSFANNAQQASGFSNLTLEVTVAKEEFIQFEPIPLTLTLSNKTDQPIFGHSVLDLSSSLISLLVGRDNSELQEVEERLSLLSGGMRVHEKIIRPGENHQSKQLLTIHLDKIFPETGSYQIQFVLRDLTGQEAIKSNRLKIRIREPKDLETQALYYITSKAYPSYFLTGSTSFGSDLNSLQEFVSHFRETPYGDYAAYKLGRLYFVREQYEAAIESLEKLATKPDFIFATQVLSDLVQANDKLGNTEKAKRYLDMLKTQYYGDNEVIR
jgi:TolA-binding protein